MVWNYQIVVRASLEVQIGGGLDLMSYLVYYINQNMQGGRVDSELDLRIHDACF